MTKRGVADGIRISWVKKKKTPHYIFQTCKKKSHSPLRHVNIVYTHPPALASSGNH